MKKIFTFIFIFAFASTAFSLINPSLKTGVDDLIDQINARLSHSQIIRIDNDGMVYIKTPMDMIEFPIQETVFNYNASGNRVRVANNYNINRLRNERLIEVAHRISFTSPSRRMAFEAIDAFRDIKELFSGEDKKNEILNYDLPLIEESSEYRTLGEAIHFINDNLQLSLIMSMNNNGIMLINSPSELYEINLKEADFSEYDWTHDPKVRIYGDWCVRIMDYKHQRAGAYRPRVEFNVHSVSSTRSTVRALYHIKGALLGNTSGQIDNALRVQTTPLHRYRDIDEAVKYINDRLEISIITDIDKNGMVTINASEHIYKIPIKNSRFRIGRRRFNVFLGFEITSGSRNMVEIFSPAGLERYRDKRLQRRINSEQFTARSRFDASEIIKALEFIQEQIK